MQQFLLSTPPFSYYVVSDHQLTEIFSASSKGAWALDASPKCAWYLIHSELFLLHGESVDDLDLSLANLRKTYSL